jgi:hypothetical protein
MFGKSESKFDADQNKQLQQLIKNQTIIIQNQNQLLKNSSNHWAWIQNLDARVKNLESRMTLNEKRDAEQAELFANLSHSASQTTEETT